MASEQLKKAELKTAFMVLPSEFSYVHGEWSKPTPSKTTAELVHGNKVDATATVNIGALPFVSVMVGVSRPTESSGWTKLIVSAELGDKRVVRDITSQYLEMTPGGREAYYILPGILHSDGTDKELRLKISDETEHPKVGLVFYGAFVQ